MRRLAGVGGVCLTFLGLAMPARAQINVPPAMGTAADSLTPGARALGIGGAFIGLADDISTAVANPAGLRLLTRTEIQFDFRKRAIDAPFALRGHLFGPPTGLGPDTVAGVEEGFIHLRASPLPAFAAISYPGRNWGIAAFWNQRERFHYSDDGDFINNPDGLRGEGLFITQENGQVVFLPPPTHSHDMIMNSFGGAVSYNLMNRLSIGASISVDHMGGATREERGGQLQTPLPPQPFPVVGLGRVDVVVDPEETTPYFGLAYTLGVLWTPTRLVQVGFIHHREREGTIVDEDELFVGTGAFTPIAFRLPDRTGGGVTIRATERGRVMVDVVHVRYSTLGEDFRDLYCCVGGPSQAPFYRYPNVTEIHVGGEYVVSLGGATIAARGGWWVDPDHAVIYSGSDRIEAALFPLPGADEHHFSAGAGVQGSKWTLDAGFDTSKLTKRLTVSILGRF